jgi:polar amino acid transport system substrate-binding protein
VFPFLGRRTFLVGLAAGVGLAAMGKTARAADFRAVSHTWAPWNLDPAGAPAVNGIASRMARAVFDAAGLSVEMQILPWQRSLNELRQGRSQLGWSTVRTPDREAYLAYSKPLWLSSCLVFAAADNPTLPWNGWKSLEGGSLGVTRGYSYGIDPASLRTRNIRIVEIGGEDIQLSMLLNKRIDAFIMEWQSYLAAQRRRGALGSGLVPTGIRLPELSFHIVASRTSPEAMALLPVIDRAIDALRKNGTMDALMREGLDPTLPPAGVMQSRLPPE